MYFRGITTVFTVQWFVMSFVVSVLLCVHVYICIAVLKQQMYIKNNSKGASFYGL